jgi:ATP-dependent DNA ligase
MGAQWYDGFRIMARRDSHGLRLFTRNGYNFAGRFPTIVAAIASLPVRSCLIDGEAIVVDESGLSVFELLRYRRMTMPPCFALSILSSLMATTCDEHPSRNKT